MPKRAPDASSEDTKGKRITFDLQTWDALDLLARERMMTFQELADEAFRDVLRKYHRPYDLRDALKKSARKADAADAPVKNSRASGKKKAPNSKRPTGGGTRRARS